MICDNEIGSANVREVETLLVGFRIDGDSEQPDYYTLLFGEASTPILKEARFILFVDFASAGSAWTLADNIGDNVPDKTEYEQSEVYWVDFAEALYLVQSADEDLTARILNLFNVLSDMFAAVHVKLPLSFRDDLNALAKHLTFYREYGAFLAVRPELRENCINGIIWCLGALLAHSQLVR